MVGDEDCLRIENPSSAVAPDAALRPRGISGSGVAFFLDTFSWLRKKKYLASRARDGINGVQIESFCTPYLLTLERFSYLWKPHGYWLAGQVW